MKKEINLRVRDRIRGVRSKLERLMAKQAHKHRISLLSIDMLLVAREHESLAIANILPQAAPAGQFVDFALLYIDAPLQGVAASFLKLQLRNDSVVSQARLVDLDGQVAGQAHYHAIDIFASVAGAKRVPAQKLPVFETFDKTHDRFVVGGTHADGQAFVVVLDL